jgi:hypothetical protein
MAFVEIEKTSFQAVHAATVKVFKEEGYQVLWSKPEKLVFVREATLDDRLRYARYEESLRMRVELTLERYGEDGVLVRAEAYAVRGDSGRSEVQVLRVARRPYMELLRRVKTSMTPVKTSGQTPLVLPQEPQADCQCDCDMRSSLTCGFV